jgi:hypothetical protein
MSQLQKKSRRNSSRKNLRKSKRQSKKVSNKSNKRQNNRKNLGRKNKTSGGKRKNTRKQLRKKAGAGGEGDKQYDCKCTLVPGTGISTSTKGTSTQPVHSSEHGSTVSSSPRGRLDQISNRTNYSVSENSKSGVSESGDHSRKMSSFIEKMKNANSDNSEVDTESIIRNLGNNQDYLEMYQKIDNSNIRITYEERDGNRWYNINENNNTIYEIFFDNKNKRVGAV